MKNIKFTDIKKKLEYILPLSIIIVTIMFIIFNIDYSDSKQTNTMQSNTLNKMDSEKITINFSPITTSQKVYSDLTTACTDYIEKNINKPDTKVNTHIKINEDTYVDDNNSKSKQEKDIDDTLYETGPIYLQDKLLLRYINEKGEMNILLAMYTNEFEKNMLGIDNSQIEVFGYKDIPKLKINNPSTTLYNNLQLSVKHLNEQYYLYKISNIFLDIVKGKEVEKENSIYFKDKQYDIIINELRNKGNDDSIINYVEAGKSKQEVVTKDRVLLQIQIEDNNYISIIIKLNDEYKIFDIDIL